MDVQVILMAAGLQPSLNCPFAALLLSPGDLTGPRLLSLGTVAQADLHT